VACLRELAGALLRFDFGAHAHLTQASLLLILV
jgi:hypothetical protein